MEQRFYEEYAEIQDRHWWFAGRRRIIGAMLTHALGPSSGDRRRILDVGCGTGAMLSELGGFGAVQGVDPEPAAVDYCRRRGLHDVERAAGASLPFADASFDLVTLLDVIEHVEDDREVLREAARVLRPGGLVLVTVPAYGWMWGEQDEISHHKRRYTRPELLAALAGGGLEVSRATYFNTVLFAPIAAIRLARRLRPSSTAVRSDFERSTRARVNAALARLFGWEAAALRHIDLPFGVSILAIARRARLADPGGSTAHLDRLEHPAAGLAATAHPPPISSMGRALRG